MEHWLEVARDWAPVAGFASIAIAVIAFLQLRMARKQFAATRRAKLVVSSCEVCWRSQPVPGVPEDARGLGARLTVVNKGAGKAHTVAVRGAVLVTDPQNVSDYLINVENVPRTLASGERIDFTIFVDADGGGAVPFIRDAPIRCIGRITYADGDGRKRETGFARLYVATSKRWISEPGSQHDYAY